MRIGKGSEWLILYVAWILLLSGLALNYHTIFTNIFWFSGKVPALIFHTIRDRTSIFIFQWIF